jgi:DNA polymerase
VERELHKRVFALSPRERKVWLMDYAINQRGVQMDLETARAGAVMADQIKEKAGRELAELTDGAVTSPTALIPLKQWLDARGCPASATGLNKEAVADLLAAENWPPEVMRALQIRQEAGKASVAKLNRMQELACDDGRLRNWAQYYGAGTGRWAARGVQVHNLVRDMPPPEVVEEIMAAVRNGELEWIGLAYGPPMSMISRCSRSFFVAPDGKVLIAGDFAGVESRGGAWFSGEQWKIDAFIAADNKTGPGVYELTASRTLGVPLERITKDSPERQSGKVQELAFLYQGGVAAARKFLPASMKDTPPDTLNAWKLAWRAAHPKTKATWGQLEDAAINAVLAPGTEFTAGFPGRHVVFKKAGSFLWCKLPSGRVLCYPYPKLLPGKYSDQLTYMTVPSENDSGRIITDLANANNWARIGTYGGALMENIIQAICRDLLVDCMLELDSHGLAIVLHVHDEIVIESQENVAGYEQKIMEDVMRTPSPWAAKFPLRADCHAMKRYGKP